ncbi:MAG: putative Pol polyprotein, partial [Streblomastix strix]
MYKAMCFGIRHAPLVFHKTMRPVMEFIRKTLQVRGVSYCDDLVFLSESKEDIQLKAVEIVAILERFGWKISREKSILNPTQQFEYLGWFLDTKCNHLNMTKARRVEMLQLLSKWRRSIELAKIVRIKLFASLLGKLNFLRTQIKRGGLYLRKMNKQKQQAVNARNWASQMWINRSTLSEINWWSKAVRVNSPVPLIFIEPEVVLTTDSSKEQWGGTIKILSTGEEIKLAGTWTKDWILKSSNQRETAAVLLGMQEISQRFSVGQLKSIRIQSDNSTAIFDINRGAAAPALASLIDKILQLAELLQVQISAFHIPGRVNNVADFLSRLATSGDYEVRQEVLKEALFQLKIKPTIDIFANRKNRKCRCFYSLVWDRWAETQDGFKMSWKKEIPLLHPPIMLIQRVLYKITKDQIEGEIVVPNRQAQSWQVDLQKITVKQLIVGRCAD